MPAKGIGISPYITTKKKGGGGVPTSTNATVQAWLNKIGTDGYAYPSQAKVDIYTTAWDYADAQGLTAQFDIVGLTKVGTDAASQANLLKIPFIHSAGAAARFTIVNQGDLLLRPSLGIANDINTGTLDGYVNLNFTASTQAVKATLNSTSYGAYLYNRLDEPYDSNNYIMGIIKNTVVQSGNRLLCNSVQLGGQVNTNSSNLVITESSTNNCFITNVRTNANDTTTYLNGTSIGTSALKPSTELPPFSMILLNLSVNGTPVAGGGYTNGATAFFYFGSGVIDQAKMNTFVNLLLL